MGDFRFEVWPTEHHKITQHFGVNSRNYAQFGLPGHDGIDIRAPSGSKVFCVAAGEVFRIHNSPKGHNYGIHVRVLHQDGYKTIYAHLEKVLVREGQIVKAGTVLGLADNTGNSFGSHLHITLKKVGAKVGNWPHNIIDPTPFLLPLLGWKEPAGPFIEGWVLRDAITVQEDLAQVNDGGATLYVNPSLKKLIPAKTIIMVQEIREPFALVRVSRAALGLDEDQLPKATKDPPEIIATVDGWAWKQYLVVTGNQAVVGAHGVDLRQGPSLSSRTIGLVKAHSIVSLRGPVQGIYYPVRVRRNDLMEPVNLLTPLLDPDGSWAEAGYLGWVLTQYLTMLNERQALASRLGVNLRNKPDDSGQNIGLVKAYATVSIAGLARGNYTPIIVPKEDTINPAEPMPDVVRPEPLVTKDPPAPGTSLIQKTASGWAFTNGLTVKGDRATVAQYGSNLRAAPRRDGRKIGYIPPETVIIVTGPPRGEYTPVRVAVDLLEPAKVGDDIDGTDAGGIGQVQIGLHASADPEIRPAEFDIFQEVRPGIIKVLSFHKPDDITRLAAAHPKASWVVRAFLSFGGRVISPFQFVDYTLNDVRRTLDQLSKRDVVVELHNEPNTVEEGLGASWRDGTTFSLWWRDVLAKYRRALPGVRFIYPGLSPGNTVSGVKEDHIRFLEASRKAVEAADGLGVHLYWSEASPMNLALEILDDYIARFRSKPIWITEASLKGDAVSPARRAQEYLNFWRQLQSRPVVHGVTYFIASASDPRFSSEVWVGKGIGKLVGKR